MTFSPSFQTPSGDSFIGRLAWAEDATPANTGKAFVFRSAAGDIYYVDQADETGAKMNEALFTFSECPAQGVYKETYRLDAAQVGTATAWIWENDSGVTAQDGSVGNTVTIPDGYRAIDFRALSGSGNVVFENPNIGGSASGLGYVIGGAGWSSVQADVGEAIVGSQTITVDTGAIIEIAVAREA